MSLLVHHLALVIACASLFGLGHRMAAYLTPIVLERLVCAAVLAAATAVLEALALGLVGLGADPTVLTLAAVGSYLGGRRLCPGSSLSTREVVAVGWRGLGRRHRAAVGASTAVALLLTVWPLRYPLLGFDGIVYHLPEVAGWVHSGHPGRIEPVSYLFPFANYPVTNEVALTWATGISQSLVPVELWTQLLFLLAAAAGFLGLRSVRVPPAIGTLTVAAVLSTPVVVAQLNTPSSDVAALAWLACTAGLAGAAVTRPSLLASALVAAGLAAGTKTSTLPLALVVVALALWKLGSRVWRHVTILAWAATTAVMVGGVWYIRNAITHGSPLWPFASFPAGERVPHVWRLIAPSLLERPHATLAPRLSGYLDAFAGALILFAGGSVTFALRKSLMAVLASAICVGMLVLWAAAPSTGQPDTPIFDANVLSTTRYAIPAIAAAGFAVAVAVSSRQGRRSVVLAVLAVLAAATVWSLVRDVELGHFYLPYAWALAAAAAGGAMLAGLPPVAVRMRRGRTLLPAVSAVGIAGLLAVAADGVLARHAQTTTGLPGVALVRWATAQPGFGGLTRVSFAGGMLGSLAGDRLQHPLRLVAPSTPCAEIAVMAKHEVVVVEEPTVLRGLGVSPPTTTCLSRLHPTVAMGNLRVYGQFAPAGGRG